MEAELCINLVSYRPKSYMDLIRYIFAAGNKVDFEGLLVLLHRTWISIHKWGHGV